MPSETALPNFITEIDGLDIHFIHIRSKHENALPLIVTHGWARLGRRGQRHCVGRLPRGDPVDPGLRVLRQADLDRVGTRSHRALIEGRGASGNPNPMEAHAQADYAMHGAAAV
jgi:hypothetical protein